MIGGPTNTRIVVSVDVLPAQYLDALEPDEKALVEKVGARHNTATLYVIDTDKDALFAYAVIGKDDRDRMTIWAGRTMTEGMAKIMFKSAFGAAQILGTPLRVHTDKVKVLARLMGAGDFFETFDTDGLPQGVFNG